MDKLATRLGRRIRSYRISLGYSQERLAELASCHPTYIGQIERGEKNVTLESIEKIAFALGVSLSQLFEKMDCQTNSNVNYPLMCYEILLNKEVRGQQYIYNLLKEAYNYSNN